MADESFVNSPMKPIAPVPAGYKGGPGVYDGEHTGPCAVYPRTPSPNAVPEKMRDGSVPKIEVPIPSGRIEGLPSKG